MSVGLSVDWDYFFETPEGNPDADLIEMSLYDWGHGESDIFLHSAIWETRAGSILASGREMPGLSGEEEGFWSRFRFSPVCSIHVADSHRFGSIVFKGFDQVINFDAHHDLGYYGEFEGLDCGNWARRFLEGNPGSRYEVRYPRWKSWEESVQPEEVDPERWSKGWGDDPVEVEIDRVFICRSGAWTPPWLDEGFEDFILECRKEVGVPGVVGWDVIFRRMWDQENVERLSAQILSLIPQLEGLT
jgi:hypothetical protein